MKRHIWLIFILSALCLTLSGCAPREAAWSFSLETWHDADDYTARDGTMLAWYVYELPRLTLTCDLPGAEPPTEMAAARDVFNAEIAHRRALLREEYHELEQLAIGTYIDNGAEGFEPLGQSLAVTQSYRTARLLSVRADGFSDWGGAHPVAFAAAWNFDLEGGAFVTWRNLTDRPDALRAALASEILTQIETEQARCFPDCAARVEALEGADVYFSEDGVHIVFSAYTIAPYASGLPEFTVPYQTLAPYWNEYGGKLLKTAG